MNLSQNIKRLRKSHGYTQRDLASILKVKPTSISAWESGRNKPLMDKITIMSTLFGVSTSELVGDTFYKNDINDIYNQLNPDRQQNVYNYADNQLKEQNGKVVNLPLVGKSAANPTELTYGDVEIEHDDFTDVPHGADTAIRIQGDSMEPLIHDGQIIFYHQQEEVENGEIAIVEIDGDGVTCKQIYYDYTSDEVILRSINKKYEPRHVKDEQVRIIGRVIL